MRPSLLPLLAAVPVAVALHGCATVECGSTQGFVTGKVTNPNGGTVTVMAITQSGVVAEATPDDDGTYELNLAGDLTWTISARSDEGFSDTGFFGGTSCFSSDHTVKVKACKEYTINLNISSDCLTADKPNLYLYPDTDTPMSVTLDHDVRQDVFASDPPYGDGWKGTAHPDGTFTTADGTHAPFLFYEITVLPRQGRTFQRASGVCLSADEAVQGMADLLGAYGFNARERDDFVKAWTGTLPSYPRYAVYPQQRVDQVVGLELTPSLPVERVWLVVEDGTYCDLDPFVPMPLARKGAHGVEWGVVLHH